MDTVDTAAAGHRPAVIIVTDLVVLSKHLSLVAETQRRGLTPLFVFGPETPAAPLARHRADPRHPLPYEAELVHVDDTSLDTLLLAVQPWLRRHDITAVLNVGEVFVESAGALAQTLGLPGPGAHAARVCRHKMLQRLAVPRLAPRWRPIDPADHAPADDEDLYPAVLKPVGRMSSSGVRAVDDPAALRAELPHYPARELLLLEERVHGAEFSVESLVHDGTVVWAGITAKRTNEDGTSFFTETGHTSPAPGLRPQDEQRLLDANAELLHAIGFGSGMSHAEFRLTGDRAVLMEVAARPPGDAITRLWHLATGRPLEPALVDLALGIRPEPRTVRRRAHQIYLEHPHGILREVEADGLPVLWVTEDGRWPELSPTAADAPARACAVVVSRHRGELLGDIADSGQRSVSLVVDGPLDEDIDAAAAKLAHTVRIHTDPAPAGAPTERAGAPR